MIFRTSFAALGLMGLSAPAIAQNFTDPALIDREVASFLGMSPTLAGTAFVPVDRRLKLTNCAQPLSTGWQGTRRDSVLVQCPQPGGWKVYVRLVGQPAAEQAQQAAVKRGQAVTVTLRGSGFSVSQSAQALEDGATGDWIRIRVGKETEMQAEVLRPGAVGVNLQ